MQFRITLILRLVWVWRGRLAATAGELRKPSSEPAAASFTTGSLQTY